MFALTLGVEKELYRKLADSRMLDWKLDAFKAIGLTKLRTKRLQRRFTEILDGLKGLNAERSRLFTANGCREAAG